MRYARIFCGWSKRPKPNESRRALTRSAGSSFADFRVGLKVDQRVLVHVGATLVSGYSGRSLVFVSEYV
jgi:hypothetical protein